MNTVQIKRDPFARATLFRSRHTGGSCGWCGQPSRFEYYWQDDATGDRNFRRGNYPGFCSVGCYRAYTGDNR